MPPVRPSGPLRGNADQFPFVDQPWDACAPDGMVNIWPQAGKNGRKILGRRPQIVREFSTKLGDGPVQVAGLIGRSVSAVAGWATPVKRIGGQPAPEPPGETIPDTPPADFAWSIYRVRDGARVRTYAFTAPYDTVECRGVRFSTLGTLTAWDTMDGKSWALAWGWADKDYGGAIGVKRISVIKAINIDAPYATPESEQFEVEDKAVGGSVAAGAVPIEVQDAWIVGPYILAVAGKYLYVFGKSSLGTNGYKQRLSLTGDYVKDFTCMEVGVNQARMRYDEDGDALSIPWDVPAGEYNEPADYQDICWVLLGYRGTRTVAGPVASDTHAQGNDIRAGVAIVRVNLPHWQSTNYPDNPVQHGPIAGLFYPLAETPPHNDAETNMVDFRISEWFDGHGRVPMCILSHTTPAFAAPTGYMFDGSVFVGTVNDGYGAGTDPPDGSNGYWNVIAKFRSGDTASTEAGTIDLSSRREDWQTTGYFSDKPWEIDGDIPAASTLGPVPSLTCIKGVDATYKLFAAGSFADGSHVRTFDPTGNAGGRPQWQTVLGGSIPRHGMDYAFDPRSGIETLVAGTVRNSSWDGSGGGNAAVFLLNPRTGEVTRSFDLGVSIDCRCVSASRNGLVAVAHTFVT